MAKIQGGYSTLTPTLIVNGAAQAIDLYKKAFNAEEVYRMECPQSKKIMHACVEIGNSKVFIADSNPASGSFPTTSSFYAYIEDVDASFQQARQAGLQATEQVEDKFWGDRTGTVKDSFGNTWTLATHVRDVTVEEMEEAQRKLSAAAAA